MFVNDVTVGLIAINMSMQPRMGGGYSSLGLVGMCHRGFWRPIQIPSDQFCFLNLSQILSKIIRCFLNLSQFKFGIHTQQNFEKMTNSCSKLFILKNSNTQRWRTLTLGIMGKSYIIFTQLLSNLQNTCYWLCNVASFNFWKMAYNRGTSLWMGARKPGRDFQR